MNRTKRIVLGISGASGVIYGIRLLQFFSHKKGWECHLVLSQAAKTNLKLELGLEAKEVEVLADHAYDDSNLAAAISSGSFVTEGMIVAPCSIKTLSAIAHSYDANLLVRAADVCLKEKRKLVLMPRETPLHAGHLELMTKVAHLGGVILPPIPAFYHHPKSLEEVIDHSVGKTLDLFGIEHDLYQRWPGAPSA